MTTTSIHPFIEVMRKYAFAYTASHDFRVCDDIMVPEYRLCMGPHCIAGREDGYKPAVRRQFDQFPGLGFVVHELITNGDRLAMRFSEHGLSTYRGTSAVWQGVSIYRWDGDRLTDCWVEQDYYARRRQLHDGRPDPIEPPGMDPWATSVAEPDADAESVVHRWLQRGDLTAAPQVTLNDERSVPAQRPMLDILDTAVDDIFSAGERVAFHITQRARYLGGLRDLDEGAIDREVTGYASGLATVSAGTVVEVQAVTDRLGIVKSLRPDARSHAGAGATDRGWCAQVGQGSGK